MEPRPAIKFQDPPANETAEQKKERLRIEREQYFKDLIDRKYPMLQQVGGTNNSMQKSTNNAEVQRRAQDMVSVDKGSRVKGSVVAQTKGGINTNPNVCELNGQAERMVHEQGAYYVQMAHKARRPIAQVPWFRIIGCETKTTWGAKQKWGDYLATELKHQPKQQLSVFRVNRMMPFMVCLDERYQFDAITDKRIIRLLTLYENEFNDQRTKFVQHKKGGLTEDEHKNRTSFFAREQAWREAKKRHDEKEAEKKKDASLEENWEAFTQHAPSAADSVSTTVTNTVEFDQMGNLRNKLNINTNDSKLIESLQKIKEEQPPNNQVIELRNHSFPEELKQQEFRVAVISYFRDRLAFDRCFHDLSVSVEDADFQPILVIWGLFETTEQAQEFSRLTNCNHMFLQKNLSIVDTYKWLPLDSINTQNIPITYANKHCNEIMSYKQEEARALEEYHQWERERYGEEAEFNPIK